MHDLVEQVDTEIIDRSAARNRLGFPGRRGCQGACAGDLRSMMVEMGLNLGDSAKCSIFDQFRKNQVVCVPPSILVDRQDSTVRSSQVREPSCLTRCWRERLLDDDMLTSLGYGFAEIEVG